MTAPAIEDNQPPAIPPGSPPVTPGDSGSGDEMVPASRLRGIIGQNTALQERVAAFEAAEADRERAALEANGQYQQALTVEQTRAQTLEQQNEQLTQQLSELQGREEIRLADLTERNTARIEGLPENLRSLAPTSYGPDELSAWLADAERRFDLDVAYANRATTGPAAPVRPQSDEEQRARMAQLVREKTMTGRVNNHGQQ